MKNRNCGMQQGVTILELVTAITIAAIVCTLGYRVFLDSTRTFARHERSAEALRSTIRARADVQRAVAAVSRIVRCSERQVTGTGGAADSAVDLRFSGTALLCGKDTVVGGLSKFSFTLIDKGPPAPQRNAVLQWEGVVAASGDWIGGAAMVKVK